MLVRDLLRTIQGDCELVFFDNKKVILNLKIHPSQELDENMFSAGLLFKTVERIEIVNANKIFIVLESEDHDNEIA